VAVVLLQPLTSIGQTSPLSGLQIKFVADVTAGVLQGGVVDGMSVNRDMLVATYGDGSVESFNVSGGVPVSNGDEQNSTGSNNGNTYPNRVDIAQDGHSAIFGDTATSPVVEVSDLSSGKLTPAIVYHPGTGLSLIAGSQTAAPISWQGHRDGQSWFSIAAF
jgi:hypothetical protein